MRTLRQALGIADRQHHWFWEWASSTDPDACFWIYWLGFFQLVRLNPVDNGLSWWQGWEFSWNRD